MIIHGTTDSALLPANLAQLRAVDPRPDQLPDLRQRRCAHPEARRRRAAERRPDRRLTPEDFARQYNLNPLYYEGATGAGPTIGIVTLASVDPATPEYFWSNILRHQHEPNRITLDNVDGGSGPGQRCLRLGRDDPRRRAVRCARPEREHRRLPGAEHRPRVRRRLLRRRQPERRRHGVSELGRVGDRDPGLGSFRPGVIRLRDQLRRGLPGDGGPGTERVRLGR